MCLPDIGMLVRKNNHWRVAYVLYNIVLHWCQNCPALAESHYPPHLLANDDIRHDPRRHPRKSWSIITIFAVEISRVMHSGHHNCDYHYVLCIWILFLMCSVMCRVPKFLHRYYCLNSGFCKDSENRSVEAVFSRGFSQRESHISISQYRTLKDSRSSW